MVTTPLFPLDPRKESGLREEGRSFTPEKSPETLPPANGMRKLVESGVVLREEDDKDKVRFDFPLWEEVINGDIRLESEKLEAVVATSMTENLEAER